MQKPRNPELEISREWELGSVCVCVMENTSVGHKM